MKHMTVTAAIIVEGGEILCMQRKGSKYDYISYKYEFPGGKVEAGEAFEDALSRELEEEMDLAVSIGPNQHYMTVEHAYPDFSITMHAYFCPIDHRVFERNDHHDHVWLKPSDLLKLDWAPADLPIVRKLMEDLG
ncbi:(deoxy)nucleoside triphosphate pyrophosphohydrolase [Anaerotalea alkaliphila]|uniref:8-oxo-dGTP diphosphatase n=1 Tax=Anaerotalea alkaliphila TaxID=2662126 RepID=A0A7X5HX28_9FIRM|nr:(deoxy)nucleoside triphosphate pyrophosphohydrolase [Anaerotalea alkaliphila]NDL68259.1 (deoxy)nucleoside triphosphate pyrophosphohydrolase [Anaerotalea alkaliphila]